MKSSVPAAWFERMLARPAVAKGVNIPARPDECKTRATLFNPLCAFRQRVDPSVNLSVTLSRSIRTRIAGCGFHANGCFPSIFTRRVRMSSKTSP